VVAACAALEVAGCGSARVQEGVFQSKTYRVTLPSGWRISPDGRADLSLVQEGGPAAMLVNETCGGREPRRSPDVLLRHLLFGLTDREIQERFELSVNGHPADGTRFAGTVEGSRVLGEAFVIKVRDCVYDFLYVAPPDSFEPGHRDFRRFLESLAIS
jgi:hypothetical protein